MPSVPLIARTYVTRGPRVWSRHEGARGDDREGPDDHAGPDVARRGAVHGGAQRRRRRDHRPRAARSRHRHRARRRALARRRRGPRQRGGRRPPHRAGDVRRRRLGPRGGGRRDGPRRVPSPRRRLQQRGRGDHLDARHHARVAAEVGPDAGRTTELLVALARDGERPLGAQIEDQLRAAIRSGALKPGAAVPSTRDLARQLRVSRGLVVDAYAQLGAEGYLLVRQGARPRVAAVPGAGTAVADEPAAAPAPRYDFRPAIPDVSMFPRDAWLRCVRRALAVMTDEDLGYGDPRGVLRLRAALADYLGRVRGVVADPSRFVVTSGYMQSEGLVCRALAAAGARRVAVERPGHPIQRATVARAGLEPVPVDVDAEGLRVEDLDAAGTDAVILTPAHQFPLGVALSGERRGALLAWLRARDAIAVEDDYDAEYRYDRAAVGALQGLEPDRVVYAGSASKTLAPALRIAWLAVPPRLLDAVAAEKQLAGRGTADIEQDAVAGFLAAGELDRHLRRMRARYRARRDTLVAALAEALPEASIEGIAAGLHATVRLPAGHDEGAILAEAGRRRVALETMAEYDGDGPPTLLLGYGQIAEAAIRPGVAELAAAVREAGSKPH